jgi:hypothetical protein
MEKNEIVGYLRKLGWSEDLIEEVQRALKDLPTVPEGPTTPHCDLGGWSQEIEILPEAGGWRTNI